MPTRPRSLPLVVGLLAAGLLGLLGSGAVAQSNVVILSTTTSTQDSGLLDVLVPMFEKKTGLSVKMISVGTGQALALAARGEADVTLAHAPAQEKKKYKLLFITQSKGFKHGSVDRKDKPLAPSEVAVTEIGKESGLFEAECVQDASVLTPEKLKELDAVMFYTTGGLPISPEHFSAFEEWLKSGKAMIGAHSATDTFGNFKPYYSLINGTFDGHPWGSGSTVTVTVMSCRRNPGTGSTPKRMATVPRRASMLGAM